MSAGQFEGSLGTTAAIHAPRQSCVTSAEESAYAFGAPDRVTVLLLSSLGRQKSSTIFVFRHRSFKASRWLPQGARRSGVRGLARASQTS